MAKKAELLTNNYDVADVVASSDGDAGDVAKYDDIYGFYIVDVIKNKDAALVTKAAQVKAEKTAGQAWKVGEPIYWNANGGKFTNTRTVALVGYATNAAAQADEYGSINFDGFAQHLKS